MLEFLKKKCHKLQTIPLIKSESHPNSTNSCDLYGTLQNEVAERGALHSNKQMNPCQTVLFFISGWFGCISHNSAVFRSKCMNVLAVKGNLTLVRTSNWSCEAIYQCLLEWKGADHLSVRHFSILKHERTDEMLNYYWINALCYLYYLTLLSNIIK